MADRFGFACWIKVSDGKGTPRPALVIQQHGPVVYVITGNGSPPRTHEPLVLEVEPQTRLSQYWGGVTKPTRFYATTAHGREESDVFRWSRRIEAPKLLAEIEIKTRDYVMAEQTRKGMKPFPFQIICKLSTDGAAYVAHVPKLPDVVAVGATEKEATENAKEAGLAMLSILDTDAPTP